VVVSHFIYAAGPRGPPDNKSLLIGCYRLGDDVEVHMVDFLDVQTSVNLRYRNPMGMEGNLVRDAAVILGSRSVSQVE